MLFPGVAESPISRTGTLSFKYFTMVTYAKFPIALCASSTSNSFSTKLTKTLTKNDQNNFMRVDMLLFEVVVHCLRRAEEDVLLVIEQSSLSDVNLTIYDANIVLIKARYLLQCFFLLVDQWSCGSQKEYLAGRKPFVIIQYDICCDESLSQAGREAHQGILK